MEVSATVVESAAPARRSGPRPATEHNRKELRHASHALLTSVMAHLDNQPKRVMNYEAAVQLLYAGVAPKGSTHQSLSSLWSNYKRPMFPVSSKRMVSIAYRAALVYGWCDDDVVQLVGRVSRSAKLIGQIKEVVYTPVVVAEVGPSHDRAPFRSPEEKHSLCEASHAFVVSVERHLKSIRKAISPYDLSLQLLHAEVQQPTLSNHGIAQQWCYYRLKNVKKPLSRNRLWAATQRAATSFGWYDPETVSKIESAIKMPGLTAEIRDLATKRNARLEKLALNEWSRLTSELVVRFGWTSEKFREHMAKNKHVAIRIAATS